MRRHSEFIPRSWTVAGGGERPLLPAKSGKQRSHTVMNRQSSAEIAGLTPPPKPARPMVSVSVPQTESGDKRPPKPYRPPSVVLPESGGLTSSPSLGDVPPAMPPKQHSLGSSIDLQSPTFAPATSPSSSSALCVCETQLEVDVVDPKPEFIPTLRVADVLSSDGTLISSSRQEVNGPAVEQDGTPPPPARPPKQHRLKSASKGPSIDAQWSLRSAQSIDSQISLSSSQSQSVDSTDGVESSGPALPPRGSVSSRLARFQGDTSTSERVSCPHFVICCMVAWSCYILLQREEKRPVNAEFPRLPPSETDL